MPYYYYATDVPLLFDTPLDEPKIYLDLDEAEIDDVFPTKVKIQAKLDAIKRAKENGYAGTSLSLNTYEASLLKTQEELEERQILDSCALNPDDLSTLTKQKVLLMEKRAEFNKYQECLADTVDTGNDTTVFEKRIIDSAPSHLTTTDEPTKTTLERRPIAAA